MQSQERNIYLIVVGLAGLAVCMGLGLVGCANRPSFLPTESQLAAAGEVSDSALPDSLLRGRALAVTQCASCHRFFFPHEYSPRLWPALVNNMGRQALLNRRQMEDVTTYMVAASHATRNEAESVAADVTWPPGDAASVQRGQSLAAAKCVGCHRFYQPREYPPGAWPRIVRSMARLAFLTEAQVQDITTYFVENSRSTR